MWNIEKLKTKNLNWFKLVYKDFANRGLKKELTDDEIKDLYNKLIGKVEKQESLSKDFSKQNADRQVEKIKKEKIKNE